MSDSSRGVQICRLMLLAVAITAPCRSDDTTIPQAAGPIEIDGRVDEPAWSAAATLSPFMIAATRTTASIATDVRMCFTGQGIYLAATCHDPDPASIPAVGEGHDDPAMWQGEVIELFIKPDGDRYYQFAVNSQGAIYDLSYPAPQGMHATAWNPDPPWQVQATRIDEGWQIEAFIPFAACWPWQYPPQPGETFEMKICREIHARGGDTRDALLTAWTALPGAVFNQDNGWRTVRLDGENILPNTDFDHWAQNGRMPGHWKTDPIEGDLAATRGWRIVGDALELYQQDDEAARTRLFAIMPTRRGRTYRLSMKMQASGKVFLLINGRPWIRTTEFDPPADRFETVSFEYTVGHSGAGESGHLFLALRNSGPGWFRIADPTLVEIAAASPEGNRRIVEDHGLESLAESNFGVTPFEELVHRDGGYTGPRVVYRDSGTGAEIWKVTHFIHLDRFMITGGESWSIDGRFFAYQSYFFPYTTHAMFLNGDASRLIPQMKVAGMTRWHATSAQLIQMGRNIVAYNPADDSTRTIFELPDDKTLQGRNWFDYDETSNRVLQYARAFGDDAVLRVWNPQDMSFTEWPIRSHSAAEFKSRDWLYSANFIDEHTIRYGLNHLPHKSDDNKPQTWTIDLRSGHYEPFGLYNDRFSHGAVSPGGVTVGYYPSGLAYRPTPTSELIDIGGLGGDGHMSFLYQNDIAVSGDVTDESLITMIMPKTRNVVPVAYAQNKFTGYYGSIIFVSMSPDVTKLAYTSDMLGYRDIYWAIMNYPLPPTDVRIDGNRVTWQPPKRHHEIAGYLVYRSDKSGVGFERLNREPIAGTTFVDESATGEAFYVVRSIEQSGLTSRAFSNEASASSTGPRRLFREAEYFDEQTTPLRLAIDREAVNEKSMMVKPLSDEPDDAQGTLAYDIDIPAGGDYRLWLRVRAGADDNVAYLVTANGSEVAISNPQWHWMAIGDPMPLDAGEARIRLQASGHGLRIDRLLLTSDPAYEPQAMGSDIPTAAPDAPASLRVTNVGSFHIKLDWPATDSAAVAYYNVYRRSGDEPAEAIQRDRVGSPIDPAFVDIHLRPGQTYHYTVTAVDNWSNESDPIAAATVRTTPLVQRVMQEVSLEGMQTLREQPIAVKFDAPVADTYVVWLHAAAAEGDATYYKLNIDGRPKVMTRFAGVDLQPGQDPTERLQWQRVMYHMRDAGTRFELAAGEHTLELMPWPDRNTHLLIDAVLITNDQSYIPPGERFLH